MRLFGGAKRVVSDALEDNITGEAAKSAYYFFLSLFPMLLVLFAVTGIVGGEAAFERIMSWLSTAMPEEAMQFVEGFVRDITDQSRPGLLSIGILLTVWAASNFFAALGDGLDVMFDVRDRTTWWKKRLKALLLMVVGGITLVGGAFAILAGPWLADILGLSEWARWFSWPIVFAMLVTLFWLIYYIMPAHRQDGIRRELLYGAIAGAVLWLVAAGLFRFYVRGFADYGATYGFLGGIIVLLLWLYISSIAILFGGEVAHTIAGRRAGGPEHDAAVPHRRAA